ncbi:MAG: hypothetical protein ACE148_16350 [Vicinamibacterales bacterium]
MSRVRTGASFLLAFTLMLSVSLLGEVKTREKSLVKFEGGLGRVVGLFGGKAAREGIVNTVAVQGDRKATMSEQGGQIIDLAEEKVYDIDIRDKSYKVTTFAELRRQMEEARKEAQEEARKQEGRKEEQPKKEFEVDFDVKATGQARAINGFDCKQVIATITVREKGKKLEESGGIVMTADMWMAPTIAAMKEVRDFDRRYAEKLYGLTGAGVEAQQMAMAMALWPGMQDAMAKWQAEGSRMDGTPILTTLTVSGVKGAEQAAAEAKQEDQPKQGGIGGLMGGIGRRIAKKKPEDTDASKAGRTTIMTTTNEVLSVQTTVAPDDVQIPAGFREKK